MRHAAATSPTRSIRRRCDGGHGAGARVSLRAGASARRTDVDGAAGVAQPDRRGALVVARARHDPRKGRLVSESLAQSVAQPPDAGGRGRHRVSRGDRPRRRRRQLSPARCARCWRSAWASRCLADAWDGAALPPHLLVNRARRRCRRAELAQGRDLARLRAQLGEAAQLSFAAAGPEFERRGIRSWDFGDLPETLTVERDGRRLIGIRRWSTTATPGPSPVRHARRGRRGDPDRGRAPDPACAQGRAAALGKGSLPVSRGGAAAEARDPGRRAARRRARGRGDRAFIGDDRCRARSALSPSRSSAPARGCRR